MTHNEPARQSVKALSFDICLENRRAKARYIDQLILKGYSPSTIKTYKNEFSQLLRLLDKTPVYELEPDDLRRYMLYAIEVEGIKENTAHSRLNALKFYFEKVLGQQKFFYQIARPKKLLILPKILGEDELGRLFGAMTNIKHKAMLYY